MAVAQRYELTGYLLVDLSDNAKGLLIKHLVLCEKMPMFIALEIYLTHCFGSVANFVQMQYNNQIQVIFFRNRVEKSKEITAVP